jgi:hypothetical protein
MGGKFDGHRGVVSKLPVLQGTSPAAAVVIAFFEFIFYWCIIETNFIQEENNT